MVKLIHLKRLSCGALRMCIKIDFPSKGLTIPPYAISADKNCRMLIPDFDSFSRVEQYHLYYIMDKSHFAIWPNDKIPRGM